MTENTINVFVGFLAGFNLGLVVAATFAFFKVKRWMLDFYNREKTTIDKMTKPATTQPTQPAQDDSVAQRLNRASDLTRVQNEIIAQAQQPSQNSLHSKHKNALVQQYKAIEVEKMGILHSIIKDGHDPFVTVFNATSKQNEEVKLSFFLSQFVPSSQQTTNTESNTVTEGEGIRKVVKDGKEFFVIDGGKKTTQ
jgi:hypothetical protein